MADSIVAEGRALQALVNLILVLADNKYFLGRRLSEWCPGGPSLESSVAAAALAQEELGHARALYPLLEDMPVTEAPGPLQRGNERDRRYVVSFLDEPLETWAHVVAALALVDPALTVMFNALKDCRFEDLRKRAAQNPRRGGVSPQVRRRARPRPRAHRRRPRRAAGARRRTAARDAVLVRARTTRTASRELKAEGLLSMDSAELRAAYLDDIRPVLEAAQISLTTDDLPWDRWNQLQRRLS